MTRWMIATAACAVCAAPAFAQDSNTALPDPNDRSDSFTIGAGAAWMPDYEGADEHKIVPAGAIRARIGGIGIFSRATYLYVDLVPRGSGKLDFDAGPIAGVRFNRTGHVKDPVVDLLPRRNRAIEVGGFAGLTLHGLTNPYDALSFRVDVVKDVGNAHKSTLVTPTLDFGTPLSKTFYIGASASAEWAGDGYADYYYSITPADSLASGLPVYQAKGGFKNWKVGLLANQSITGNLLHGLSLFGTVNYGRLKNAFADSPIVSLRGSPKQTLAALGLAYSF